MCANSRFVKHNTIQQLLTYMYTDVMVNIQVYTGKDESNTEVGLGGKVVKDLTSHIKGKGHHCYMDNFFTSPQLLVDLHKDCIYGCGTIKMNRKGFPTQLEKPKLENR